MLRTALTGVGTAAALTGAAAAALPATEHTPSGLTVLRLLPAGLAGALRRAAAVRVPPTPSLEASVRCGAVEVFLCGTCHFEPASATAARECVQRVERLRPTGRIVAVLVESDAPSLAVTACAHKATAGLPRERVRSEGVERATAALAQANRLLAAEANVAWDGAATPPLPSLMAHFLQTEGVLFGGEMCSAAIAGAEAGARVLSLRDARDARDAAFPRVAPWLEQRLGQFACWLRASALAPNGYDERSCDAEGVHAANAALRELLPAYHDFHVAAPDARWARRVRALCEEVASGATLSTGPARVVVVVGARHLPGLQALLSG